MARMESRSSEAVAVARAGAVIGRSCDLDMIAAVTGRPAEYLARPLAELADHFLLLPARVPGTVVGVVVVDWLADRTLGIVVGVMVLIAVGLTLWTIRVPVNRRTLVTAGCVSGVTGTATSIGGPQLALLYQHRPGAQVRSTLAVYFIVGASLSLVGLALGGALHLRDLAMAAVLAPFLLVGFAAAGPVRARIDVGHTRKAVLAVCAASAIALLVRSLVG